MTMITLELIVHRKFVKDNVSVTEIVIMENAFVNKDLRVKIVV